MYAELKDEKSEMIQKKTDLERELEHTADTDPMKNVIRNKIMCIEEKL